MTDYWKSGAKYWCEDCRKFITDNKVSRKHHETGATHLDNRRKRLNEMKNKKKEKAKEDSEVDREIERARREASHAEWKEMNQGHASAPKYAAALGPTVGYVAPSINPAYEQAMMQQQSSVMISSGQPRSFGNWNYFDEEMIEAQKKRLYGSMMMQQLHQVPPIPPAAQVPKNKRKRQDQNDKEGEQKEEGGGEGNEGKEKEKKEKEEGDESNEEEEKDKEEPEEEEKEEEKPIVEDKPKKRKKFITSITRETAGIPGQYKVVDASALYNEYYSLDPEIPPEGQYPPIKQENETDPLSYQDAYAYQQYYQQQYQDWQYYQQQQQQSLATPEQPETKKRDTELFDPEDQWDAKEVLSKEKVPEKSLAQILQTEEQTDITFKKPKQSSANAKRGRRKK